MQEDVSQTTFWYEFLYLSRSAIQKMLLPWILTPEYDQIHKKVSEKKNANETLEKDIKKAKEE